MTLPEETTIAVPVTLTKPAADAVREIITHKNLKGYALRLYITGGGCSGYQYNLALDNRHRAEDTVIETDGIRLVVDEVTIKYVQGATVDYVEEPDASGFKIINPHPISSCSCGENCASSEDESSEACAGCG
jgi:iron-sulfur cluster assembly accessory protein